MRFDLQMWALSALWNLGAPQIQPELSPVEHFDPQSYSHQMCGLPQPVSPVPMYADVRRSPWRMTFDRPALPVRAATGQLSPACGVHSSLLAPPASDHGGSRSDLH
jgi:hypothetical protein